LTVLVLVESASPPVGRQPGKKEELDGLHEPGARFREARKRSIDRQHVVERGRFAGELGVQSDAYATVAALGGPPAPGVIDRDLAHGSRGDREEVAPVFPIRPGLIDQAQIRLVDEGRRAQRRRAPPQP
jgi:hypothetical protein